MDWNDLRYFLVLGRSESLTEASRQLRVSQSTVSRRIDALEHAVSKPLFHRRQTGYVLNEAGRALFAEAEAIEVGATAFQQRARSDLGAQAGPVRIAMPELLGVEYLLPRLIDLLAAHPGITLDVMADVRPLRLRRREADILVRLIRPDHGEYRMRRAAGLAVGLYGSDRYLKDRPPPLVSHDLGLHRLIGWLPDLHYLIHAAWLMEKVPLQTFALRTSTMAAQFAAVKAGLGLAALPVAVAERAGLVRVLTGEPPLIVDIWVVTANEMAPERVRTVTDYLTDILVRVRDELNPFG